MSQKAALIFIAGKIRQGQFPRVPGFAYSEEYGKYLYGGAPVPLDEFNAAAEVALDPAEKRFSLSVRIVDVLTPEEKAAEAARIEAERVEAEKVEAARIAAEAESKRLADEETARVEAEAKRVAEEAAKAKPPKPGNKTPTP